MYIIRLILSMIFGRALSFVRYWAALALASLAAAPMFAHAQDGSLSGTVTGTGDIALSDATIRAVNTETGAEVRVRAMLDGRYEIEVLPGGIYTVSAGMPCCSFQEHTEENVSIGVGESVRLDLRLEETLHVLGDDPALMNAAIRARQEVPDAPVPRDSEGRPDLTGVWFHSLDPLQDAPIALEWAEEIAQERIANGLRDHPHNRCLPAEVYSPGAASFMLKLVQTPDLLVILFEDVPGFRQVFLDGRAHPSNPNPTWMGHSVGRWEGDTLVIETVGFNDRGWNGVYPSTEEMRLEERLTRTEYGTINVVLTIDDPGVYEQPWVRRMRFDLAPQEELFEYVCETNKWGPADEN